LLGQCRLTTPGKCEQNAQAIIYKSAGGEVRIIKQPWHIEFYDKTGHLLTRTQNIGDPATFITPIPFRLYVDQMI
jgi:hypothetical protein